MHSRTKFWMLACLAALMAASLATLAADSYSITDLGQAGLFGINDNSQIAGAASFGWPPQVHPFLYSGTNFMGETARRLLST